jgi:hypothetical protein
VGEKKEDDEGIRFHTSLTTGTHRRDRISWRKRRRRVCSSVLGGCVVSVRAACRGNEQGRGQRTGKGQGTTLGMEEWHGGWGVATHGCRRRSA